MVRYLHSLVGENLHYFYRYQLGESKLLLHLQDTRSLHSSHSTSSETFLFMTCYEYSYDLSVFRNGDENFRGVRVLLTQRTLYSMDHVRVFMNCVHVTDYVSSRCWSW